jgi:hypothetical protein
LFSIPARAAQKALPRSFRHNAHHGAFVRLTQ